VPYTSLLYIIIYKEITRIKQSAIHKASWISRHRQFGNTTAALRFGLCIRNAIRSYWSEI